jgi:hypothetical protein
MDLAKSHAACEVTRAIANKECCEEQQGIARKAARER